MKKSVCVPDLNYVKITYADAQYEKRKRGGKVFSLIVKIYFYSNLKKKKKSVIKMSIAYLLS